MDTKPLRIVLLLGWYFPDSVGGTETYVRLLSQYLRSAGHRVFITAPSQKEEEEHYEYEGIPVYRYPVAQSPSYAEIRMEREPRYFAKFKEWLDRIQPDVVHLHCRTRGAGFFHAKYAKERGIPLIITIHAADFMCAAGTAMRWGQTPCDGKIIDERCAACWIRSHRQPWWVVKLLMHIPHWVSFFARFQHNRFGTALLMRRMLSARNVRLFTLFREADAIVAVSLWMHYVLRLNNVAEEKIALSPHGLPDEYGTVRRPPESLGVKKPLVFGFIGRFNPVKGLHVLIEAFMRTPADLPARLKIYGRANFSEDERYLQQLKRMAASEPRIEFCGEMNAQNRDAMFREMDILAIPSIWFETGPYVLLESFAYGVPILGSRLGSIPELARHTVNAYLCEPKDVASFTEAIRFIVEHPQLLSLWSRNIPPVRSMRQVCDDMIRIYEQNCKQRV